MAVVRPIVMIDIIVNANVLLMMVAMMMAVPNKGRPRVMIGAAVAVL